MIKNIVSIILISFITTFCYASYTWDGGGGDNNWSTGANWVGDVAPPIDGTESIIFAGSTRTINTNDFVGAIFTYIYFTGDFTISGNAFTLTDPATVIVTDDNRTISMSNNITFSTTGTNRSINLHSSSLTLSGTQVINDPMYIGGSTGTASTLIMNYHKCNFRFNKNLSIRLWCFNFSSTNSNKYIYRRL